MHIPPFSSFFKLATQTLLLSSTILLFSASSCSAAPTAAAAPVTARSLAPTTTVYEFPNGTWVENLAVMSDGRVLVTLFEPAAEVYMIDPAAGTASLVCSIPEVVGVLGIAEYAPNMFAVVGGNITFSGQSVNTTKGSWGVWTFDLSSSSSPSVHHVTNIAPAQLLNGLTAYNSTTVLAAESINGVIYGIDVATGAWSVVLDEPALKITSGPGPNALGVNGLQYVSGRLYFTNSHQNIAGYFTPLASDLSRWSSAVILANDTASGLPGYFDDFAISNSSTHNGYFSRGSEYTIALITASGSQSTLAGSPNSTAIANPTSAKLGRTPGTLDTLYVTTNGGLGGSLGNQQVIGGQLVAVNISKVASQ